MNLEGFQLGFDAASLFFVPCGWIVLSPDMIKRDVEADAVQNVIRHLCIVCKWRVITRSVERQTDSGNVQSSNPIAGN